MIGPLTGFNLTVQGHFIDIGHAYGCAILDKNQTWFAEAIGLALLADIVYFFGGINQTVEEEGHDRISIALPDIQIDLLQQLEKVVGSPIQIASVIFGQFNPAGRLPITFYHRSRWFKMDSFVENITLLLGINECLKLN